MKILFSLSTLSIGWKLSTYDWWGVPPGNDFPPMYQYSSFRNPRVDRREHSSLSYRKIFDGKKYDDNNCDSQLLRALQEGRSDGPGMDYRSYFRLFSLWVFFLSNITLIQNLITYRMTFVRIQFAIYRRLFFYYIYCNVMYCLFVHSIEAFYWWRTRSVSIISR